MDISCDCCGSAIEQQKDAIQCPYCTEQSYVWCSAECRATGGWAQHEPHCTGVVKGCPEGTLVCVPYAWQNLTPESSIAWESQTLKFPSTLIVHDRDALKLTVQQTLIPPVSAPISSGSERNTEIQPVKNITFTLSVNDKSLGPMRAVERVISAKSSDSRARSLAEARAASRDAKGVTYWAHGINQELKRNEVNTVKLSNEREVSFFFADTLGDIRASLGHGMEDHLKTQYKFKGLGSGKGLRTYLAVNDKTSDSVTLTVRDGATLVDLEYFAAKEPKPVQLQRQTFDLKLDERNPDDVKALCYAIEESGMLHEQLASLQRHLKDMLRNPEGIASNVEEIISIRNTIAESQRELAQIGRQLTVQDYKERFTTGDPTTLYAKYASEPNGELKTLAAKLFKRVQWRDQLQNQSQKKGFWTGQVSNVRLRVVEQEIKAIKRSLTTMADALDELIELRKEGGGTLSEDNRYAAWVLLARRIQELQRENFSGFPEAGATARDIRMKPWDRKNRKPVQRQKTTMMERRIGSSLIGMMPKTGSGFNFVPDQDLFIDASGILQDVNKKSWENHLVANLAEYGQAINNKFRIPGVRLEYDSGLPNAPEQTETVGEINAQGLQFQINSNTMTVTGKRARLSNGETMSAYDRYFRYFLKARNAPTTSANNSNNGFTMFFIIKVKRQDKKKDHRVGSISVERDTRIGDFVNILRARYFSLRNLPQGSAFSRGSKLNSNMDSASKVSDYYNGTSVFYFRLIITPENYSDFDSDFKNVFATVSGDDDDFDFPRPFSRNVLPPSGPREPRKAAPKVPRAFNPSSAADRGGERNGGVLFYGGQRDREGEKERDDFDMDW